MMKSYWIFIYIAIYLSIFYHNYGMHNFVVANKQKHVL